MSSLSVREMYLKGNDVLECEDAPGPAMHMHQRMCNEHGAKNGFALQMQIECFGCDAQQGSQTRWRR